MLGTLIGVRSDSEPFRPDGHARGHARVESCSEKRWKRSPTVKCHLARCRLRALSRLHGRPFDVSKEEIVNVAYLRGHERRHQRVHLKDLWPAPHCTSLIPSLSLLAAATAATLFLSPSRFLCFPRTGSCAAQCVHFAFRGHRFSSPSGGILSSSL
jgi:hypothetical protein